MIMMVRGALYKDLGDSYIYIYIYIYGQGVGITTIGLGCTNATGLTGP